MGNKKLEITYIKKQVIIENQNWGGFVSPRAIIYFKGVGTWKFWIIYWGTTLNVYEIIQGWLALSPDDLNNGLSRRHKKTKFKNWEFTNNL